MSDFQISPELLNIYLEDARAHIEALDHALLALERDGLDPEIIAGILGPLHTLKGNSGMMGFAGIKDYVHRLEDVFARVGQGTAPLSRPIFDRLFAGASALRDAVEQACGQRTEVRSLEAERKILEGILEETKSSQSSEESGKQSTQRGKEIPSASSPVPAVSASQSLVPSASSPVPADSVVPAVSTEYISTHSSMVRVDFSQLDHLLNLVGELIIHRTKLHQLGRELAAKAGGDEAAG